MKVKLFITIIIILCMNIYSGYSQFIFNPSDSTYKFKFRELQLVRDTIESLLIFRIKSSNQDQQLEAFMDLVQVQDEKIQKLQTRDSFFVRELGLYSRMDKIQQEKLQVSTTIINSYQTTLSRKDEEIKYKNREIKNEKNWKNAYKIGYPVLITLVGLLILTN